jgi:hypothetical protein
MRARGAGRLQAWLVVLISLSAFALLAVATPARASIALPRWSTGDYWSYDVTVNSPLFGSVSGKARMDVAGTDSITVGGKTFDAYHVKDDLNMTVTFGSNTLTVESKGDSWYRTSDLAQAKLTVIFDYGSSASTTTSTNIPPPAYQWPLTAGATWTEAYEVKSLLVSGSVTLTTFVNVTKTVTVQANTTITVPAGTFAVNQVTESGGGNTSTSSWSEKAGNRVAGESTNSYGQPVDSMKLTSYKYAAGSPTVGGLFLGLDSMAWYIIIIVVAAAVIVVAAVGMRRRSKRKQRAAPPPTMVQDMPSMPSRPESGKGPPPKI